MQKIPSLFLRDKSYPRLVTSTPDPDCLWVFKDQGWPTEKFDGLACVFFRRGWHTRHHYREEKGDPPEGWIHWTRDPGVSFGHGWIPLSHQNPGHRYHLEAAAKHDGPAIANGTTWELLGPKVQSNPYGLPSHVLLRHGSVTLVPDRLRSFGAIRDYLSECPLLEGIVWHHNDGRMAKIKRTDFGLPWPDKGRR